MSSASSMFNSPQVDSMWQEFCRSADYRQALQWGASDEVPGALFVAFRAGLWAAISAAPAGDPADSQGVHQTERLDADGAAVDAQSKLARFGALMLRAHRGFQASEVGDIDGGTAQDAAVACGVIEVREVTEPCGEDCVCSGIDDFPQGCYFIPADVRAAMQEKP